MLKLIMVSRIWLYISITVNMAWTNDDILTSFEKLNPFIKLVSNSQYNSFKTCHDNKKLNTYLQLISKSNDFSCCGHSQLDNGHIIKV